MPDDPRLIGNPTAGAAKERTPEAGISEAFRMMSGLTQALADMGRSPFFDFGAFAGSYRHNMEAMSEASRVSMQGAQSLVRCEIDMTQQMMADLNEAMQLMVSAETPLARAARYAGLIRQMSERVVANERQMCDMIRNCQREAFDLLHRRALDTMTEIKEALEKNERHLAHAERV